ncbi:MAG: VIT1/CCC1 transporter family protein [Planctomycetia bacterium]
MEHTLDRWREETQSAWIYDQLARAEPDASKRALFAELAKAARHQAGLLAAELPGTAAPRFRPSPRARFAAWAASRLGVERTKSLLAALKVRGLSTYGAGHARVVSVEAIGARHKRTGSGGTLRAAVFGVNDGLVSNASLVLGVAGATAHAADSGAVVVAGVAGMLAGAFSMAAGEWIIVRTQTELWQGQIAEERDELQRYPEAEAEELALIYHARGFELEAARAMARELVKDQERALAVLSREELGLDPDELGSPMAAALWSFGSFCLGSLVPLLPWLLASGTLALWSSIAAAAVVLFLVGAATSLFSGRNLAFGGARMLAIGAAAGAATWAIGSWLGASVL